MNKKIFLPILFITTISFSKEISVFGAGDINSDNPYGLTKTEKSIYDNKKRLESLNKKYSKLQTDFNDVLEKLDGFNSVYESDSENLNKTRKSLLGIDTAIKSNRTDLENLQQVSKLNTDSIILLEKRVDEFIELQSKNNKKVERSLRNITYLLNKINKNYVNKDEFNELVKFVNGDSKKISTKQTSKSSTKTTSVKNKLSNKEKFNKALAMFKKRYFTKSLPIWNELLGTTYKQASVNYYLGEIKYAKKRYKEAISHFKKSMMLNDEAKYIPKLLLHSAISFEKLKDYENARNFYTTIIDVYENTQEAKTAKKQLKNLK
jgi:TolA-binding protein